MYRINETTPQGEAVRYFSKLANAELVLRNRTKRGHLVRLEYEVDGLVLRVGQ